MTTAQILLSTDMAYLGCAGEDEVCADVVGGALVAARAACVHSPNSERIADVDTAREHVDELLDELADTLRTQS